MRQVDGKGMKVDKSALKGEINVWRTDSNRMVVGRVLSAWRKVELY